MWLHPQTQTFYQRGGAGGGVERMDFGTGSTVVADDEPDWANRERWERLRKEKRLPLPTHIAPRAMTDKQLAQAIRAGHSYEVLPHARRRLQTIAEEGKSPEDMAHGAALLRRTVAGSEASAPWAGIGALGPFTGKKMMSTGGVPAKYSKADVKREGDLASRMRGEAAVFASARDALSKDVLQQTAGWIQAARKEQEEAGAEAATAKAEYLKASQAIQRSRARLDAMRIDPDRYWNSMTESQQLLSRIGLLFGGFAEGLSGGRVRNAAAVAINNAIERDMRAQTAEMKKALQTIDLDERDRAAMWQRWQAGEGKRRQAGLTIMQMQLSRAGLMERRLGIKEQYAAIVNKVDSHMLDVLRQSRGRGGRKVPTPEYLSHIRKGEMSHQANLQLRNKMIAGKVAGKGKADRGENAIARAKAALPRLKKLWDNMPFIKGDHDPTGISQSYERMRTRVSVGLWRLFDSGKLSDFDMMTAMRVFFPPAKWANSWEEKIMPALQYKKAHGRAFGEVAIFLDEMEQKLAQGGAPEHASKERKEEIRKLWLAKGLATR